MNSRPRGKLAVGRVKFFGRHRGEVNSSAFSPDGQRLLTASEDGCVYGWETQSGRLLWRLRGHKVPPLLSRPWKPLQPLYGMTLPRQAYTGSDLSEVELSEAQGSLLQSGQVLRHFVGHRDSVQSSDFAPSSDCLATGSWDSTIRMWDLRARTPGIFHQELEGHRGNISCLCYSPSGLLASGSWDKTIHIWKPSTRSLLIQLKGHITWVKSIAFSPDGQQLASAGYSHMVKVWDCNTGKCTETLKGVLNVAHACAFMPDGKLLVSGAAD
uniref:WD repeat domain 38 n=1 Tax=Capra hircus TaxID=9925 RepID=A0A8C2R5I0_CAPHI